MHTQYTIYDMFLNLWSEISLFHTGKFIYETRPLPVQARVAATELNEFPGH